MLSLLLMMVRVLVEVLVLIGLRSDWPIIGQVVVMVLLVIINTISIVIMTKLVRILRMAVLVIEVAILPVVVVEEVLITILVLQTISTHLSLFLQGLWQRPNQ